MREGCRFTSLVASPACFWRQSSRCSSSCTSPTLRAADTRLSRERLSSDKALFRVSNARAVPAAEADTTRCMRVSAWACFQ